MIKKKVSPVLTIAQKRNWAKRLVLCYTAGYQTIRSKYQDSLTSQELANFDVMINTGLLLIEHWTKRKEDKKS